MSILTSSRFWVFTILLVLSWSMFWLSFEMAQETADLVQVKKRQEKISSNSALPVKPWLMFRGDQAQTGVATGTLPDKPELLWTFKAGGAVKATAAIAGDLVFIGAADGKIYALRVDTGAKVWEFTTGDGIEAAPLVLEDRLYIGSTDNFLYCLETATGALKWKYETGGKITGGANYFAPAGNAEPGFWSAVTTTSCIVLTPPRAPKCGRAPRKAISTAPRPSRETGRCSAVAIRKFTSWIC